MGVVRTDKWLQAFVNDSQEALERQQKWIIEPLCTTFKTDHIERLQIELWQLGLFAPKEFGRKEFEVWNRTHPWSIVKEEYERLRSRWDGPDCKIYILPLTKYPPPLLKQLGNKTGITLQQAIILFITPTLTTKQIRALVIHEYHHICRLALTKETEDEMTLLESMCMEGLAEWAVKEELGETYCAIWTKYYDHLPRTSAWFHHYLKPSLFQKGRKTYHVLLYGDSEKDVPIWLGYYIGFKLVEAAAKKYQSTKTMLPLDAKSLYQSTKYAVEG